MFKMKHIFVVLLLMVGLGYLYVAATNDPDSKAPDLPVQKLERIQMQLFVEGAGPSAKIDMSSISDDSADKGFVKLPYKKIFLAASVRVAASAPRPDEKVSCKITDGHGKTLDSDGPAKRVSCEYSTF